MHPQAWPADLDHRGRRVVVIGSGATAVTLVPALATDAAHVTMLQRTPTYILSAPAKDRIANALRRALGDDRAHPLVRQKNIAVQRLLWRACRRFPEQARRVIRWTNARQLPAGYPVDEHFSPPYDPWDQRLCLVPDGDFFAAIRSGSASVVTDRVRRFTETGIELESGEELEADIVVTATGLELLPFGGIELTVDGAPVDLTERLAYRGTMLDGVPNFAYAIGYTNASWTLKVGLLCTYFTRVLEHMDRLGYDACRPERPAGPVLTRPLLDFGAGYVRRAVDRLPKQGERAPWVMSMNYYEDVALLRRAPVDDGVLRFERARRATGVTV
ncbi:flavin-containing monooxygenase [Herbiconiux sp. SYSU D00978]|uniref:flavin-containing monooxygenase n=1 Tax=Herbiconiux sp. SYSU D00978 TaxID=2812562 RepID=UPI0027DC9745|nr:NAD(P)/FAD-dependent oxidoreductase [Herbiconiux sp. SYSU D00978]